MIPLTEIERITNGRSEHVCTLHVTGFAPLNEAVEGQLSFYNNQKYFNDFKNSKASLVIVQKNADVPEGYLGGILRVNDVGESMARLLDVFSQKTEYQAGIMQTATVDDSAWVHDSAYVGEHCLVESNARIGKSSQIHHGATIGENVTIGNNTMIGAGVRVLRNCVIGDNCIIHANTVIGADGFGFTPTANGKLMKIPQIGKVVIGNDVEIGANCVIDRGSIKDTIIKDGVKLDNLIQIAHNVEIGENTVIAAQSGIAGSTIIGKGCMIGGQVGIVGHLKIADGTKIQAQSGMIKSISTPNTSWYGSPAIEYQQYLKAFAIFKNLPELEKNLRKIEKKLQSLQSNIDESEG